MMRIRTNYLRTIVVAGGGVLLLTLAFLHGKAEQAVGKPPVGESAPSPRDNPYDSPQVARPIAGGGYTVSPSNAYQPRQVVQKTLSVGRVSAGANKGLPDGTWVRESALGKVTLTVNCGKLHIQFEGNGEMADVTPVARGEYSVASDGAIYGMIHNVELNLSKRILGESAGDMEDLLLLESGLHDLPFSFRFYEDADVLAIKSMKMGAPTVSSLGEEVYEIVAYANLALSGSYKKTEK